MAPNEVDQLKIKINQVDTKVDSMDKKLDKVLFHINGDRDTDTDGLVQKTRKVERDIDELGEKLNKLEEDMKLKYAVKKAMIATWVTVGTTAGGFFGVLFKWFLTYFLGKVI